MWSKISRLDNERFDNGPQLHRYLVASVAFVSVLSTTMPMLRAAIDIPL